MYQEFPGRCSQFYSCFYNYYLFTAVTNTGYRLTTFDGRVPRIFTRKWKESTEHAKKSIRINPIPSLYN
jgi:hypothetical protein